MFVLLPLRTSIYPRKAPYANYLLIGANMVIFLLSMHLVRDPRTGHTILDLRNWAMPFMLTPEHPYIWQFVNGTTIRLSLKNSPILRPSSA